MEIVFNSLLKTKHQLRVADVSAPAITNCVTAVRYFLVKSSLQRLPSVFIGDMPRILVKWIGCTVQEIKISEMQLGDLVFFKNDPNNQMYFDKQYISHIAIALGPNLIFHSTRNRQGGGIDNLAKPIDLYAKDLVLRSVDQPFLFLRYIDPRNKKLRDEVGADLIPFSIPRPINFRLFAASAREHSSEQEVPHLHANIPHG